MDIYIFLFKLKLDKLIFLLQHLLHHREKSGDGATAGEAPMLLEEADDDDCLLRAPTALGENMVSSRYALLKN